MRWRCKYSSKRKKGREENKTRWEAGEEKKGKERKRRTRDNKMDEAMRGKDR